MEILVRRLRRFFNPEKGIASRQISRMQQRKMDALDKELASWIERQGWHRPTRTLSEAAETLHTDTVTLYNYFNGKMGTDFRTWQTRLRLEEAKKLLRENPADSAADIARRVGFSNRSNFSRQFLAYTGLTPARWRQENEGQKET